MVKSVKIGILNSPGTSEPMGNKRFDEKSGQIDSQFPGILKLLTGLCIGQMVMLIVTAATLGVFVNANLKQIEELKLKSEQNQNTNGHLGWQPAVQNLDERIIELESNRHSDSAVLMAHSDKLLSLELDRNISNRALQDLHSRVTSSEDLLSAHGDVIQIQESKLLQLQTGMTNETTNIQLQLRLAQLETEIALDRSAFQNQSVRITELELDNMEYTNRVAELETDRSSLLNNSDRTIQNISERIIEIQLKRNSDISIIKAQNNTLFDLDNRLAELELKHFTVQNNSDRITELMMNRKSDIAITHLHNDTLIDLRSRIAVLESGKFTIQNNSDQIIELQMKRMSDISIVKELNDTLNDIGSQIADLLSEKSAIQNNSDRITELVRNRMSEFIVIQEQNETVTDIEERIDELESGISIVQNNSDSITKLQLNRVSDTFIIQEHNNSLNDLDSRVAELESCGNCYIVRNTSDRIDTLEMKRMSDHSGLQEQNVTLQNALSRLTAVEESLQLPSYAFYAYGVSETKVFVGDILKFSNTQLDETGVYKTTTGKYTTKIGGIYIFHATLCARAKNDVVVKVVAGQTTIGELGAADPNWNTCSSASATARLQKGDQVYLKVIRANNEGSASINGNRRCSFSGHLINL